MAGGLDQGGRGGCVFPRSSTTCSNGYVEALLAQDCYGWGTKSIDILLNKIVNNQAPSEVKVIDPLTMVTKENVDAYGGELEEVAQEVGGHRPAQRPAFPPADV